MAGAHELRAITADGVALALRRTPPVGSGRGAALLTHAMMVDGRYLDRLATALAGDGLDVFASAIDFTPNNDTVYGLAWLDLRQGSVLMTIPKPLDRYWTVQSTHWALNTLG